MVKALKVALVMLFGLFVANASFAQIIKNPTHWSFEAKKISGSKYELIIHCKIDDNAIKQKKFHIFSQNPGGDGTSKPTEIKFAKNDKVKYEGKVTEKGKLINYDTEVSGIINIYEDKVDFTQKAIITGNTKITGTYFYQTCNEGMCLPDPRRPVAFSIDITDAGGTGDAIDTKADTNKTAAATSPDTNKNTTALAAAAPDAPAKNAALAGTAGNVEKTGGAVEQKKTLLTLFILAFLGGLAAVLTPCVYSMIPITVSFFTKRSKTRKEGIRNALYYALSIIIIFTVLGVAISLIFGATALNSLSTNWIANLIFFFVFVIFGISFLGAFEIALPSSWTNATDSRAGVGSFSGIFFMALTLAIVSFSCTGPIIGPLLVEAGKGGIAGPALGMFGFSLGLSLPFALFAVFPGMLNKIASSGGWLNQVKVVLGFVELMFALKFLSNADLAKGWRLLDREIFIAFWVVLSILIGIYLLGKLKLSHDDETPKNIYGQEYVSIFKLFLAIGFFTFAVYLIPGMWGAPLNGVSAFVPPMGTFEPFGGGASVGGGTINAAPEAKTDVSPVKYVADMKIYEPQVVRSLGLVTYFDYDEAVAASKKLKKPIMLDFTGINCVNCRKMESQVWSRPEVARRLKENFVVASLYCDMNKIVLPKEQQYFSKDLNAQVETLGDKNADLQAAKFGSNSQPFYFYVDENGTKLADNGYSYDPDEAKFIKHLDDVVAKYKASHP